MLDPLTEGNTMKVESILQSKGNAVITVQSNAHVADAVTLLNEHNIGALIVVDSANKVVGILSERDVIRRMSGDQITPMAKPVSDCMTANPVSCQLETSVDDLMQLMTKRRIRHIPVIEAGRLAGMISIGDVVKRKIAETEEEAAALREYIAS